MSGRLEHEMVVKAKVMEKLADYPLFLTHYFKEYAGSQMVTKKVYINGVCRFCDWLKANRDYNLDEDAGWARITKRDVKDYIGDIRYKTDDDGNLIPKKRKTVWDEMLMIKNLFEFAVLEGIRADMPIPTKKEFNAIIPDEDVKRSVVYMTQDEVQAVANSIRENSKYPARDLCVFVLGCSHGFRAEALVEIDVNDFDYEDMVLTVTEKGRRTREVLLDEDIMDVVNDCLQEREKLLKANGIDPDGDDAPKALFVTLYGGIRRMSSATIAKMLTKNTQMLGKKISPHKMRSTCITNEYELTGDIFEAAKMAGHSNIQNTQRYINTKNTERAASKRLTNHLFGKRKTTQEET